MRKVGVGLAMLMLVACGGGGDDESGPAVPVELAPANPAAGCSGIQRFPNEGAAHIENGVVVDYRTQPPTSGSHYRVWGATGTYGKQVPDEVQVHNLEHGHVVIQYVPGAISKEMLDGLVALTRSDAKWIMLAPRAADRFTPSAALGFTSWRTGQICEKPTPAALDEAKAFVKRFKDRGRESVPGDPIKETPPTKL